MKEILKQLDREYKKRLKKSQDPQLMQEMYEEGVTAITKTYNCENPSEAVQNKLFDDFQFETKKLIRNANDADGMSSFAFVISELMTKVLKLKK